MANTGHRIYLLDENHRLRKKKKQVFDHDNTFARMLFGQAATYEMEGDNFHATVLDDAFEIPLPFSTSLLTAYSNTSNTQPHEQQANEAANAAMQGDLTASRDIFSNPLTASLTHTQDEEQLVAAQDETYLQYSASQGEALAPPLNQLLEIITGTDLSEVRIHTGSQADSMTKSIGAQAFTYGQHIYFNQAVINYGAADAMQLLLHELMHTSQQKWWQKPFIQKKDKEEDKKYTYEIIIPPGTTSKQGFRQYAEMVIFGRIVNCQWESSSKLNDVYNNITAHIGHKVIFSVYESQLRQYGVEPGEVNSAPAQNDTYNNLHSKEKKEVTDEINRRYYERTGITPGTQIQANDTQSIAIWNSIRDEVTAQKSLIDALSPEMKAFLKIEPGLPLSDYEKYAEVAKLLNQFDTVDFLSYQQTVNFSTTDLDMLRDSLAAWLTEKENRKAAAAVREDVKTRLYGLEEVYITYRFYLDLKNKIDPGAYGRLATNTTISTPYTYAISELEIKLLSELKANGFNSISEFEATIKAYEKAFEEETVRIADEHLQRYAHILFEEEKRLQNTDYINRLFASLNSTGAASRYDEANDLQNTSNAISGDLGGYAKGDRQLKADLSQQSYIERHTADNSIKALDSELVKEAQFDKEAFSRCETAEEMKDFLYTYLRKKQVSIDETREDIHAHPDHVYELDVLFNHSLKVQQIQPGSIYDLILRHKAKAINQAKILKAICEVIIALALTVVTFGAAAPYAVAAGVASVGLSLFFVYEALEDYNRQNAANDTGLLSNDPSLVWVMLAIAGAAVDVAALHSAFKAAGKIAEAATEFNRALDDAAVLVLEQKLAKIAELDARIQQNIVKQARIQAQQQKLLSSMVAARGMLTVTIPGLAQTGELVARAVFAIRKNLVSLDSFIAELRAAKLIADTGLTPEELLIVKDAFTRARTLATDEKWVAELEKAMSEGDWVRVKGLVDEGLDLSWEVKIAEEVDYYNKLKAPYLDCSDIASSLNRSYNGGYILEIKPQNGMWINGIEYGEITEFMYHQVFIKNKYVYDPMFSNKPVLTTEFINEYKKMNPKGINIKRL